MEILYLTDIHDNLKRLRYVIRNTEADLYIISGDLIYKAFFTESRLYEFVSLQEEFYYYLSQKKIRGTPSELAKSIIRMPERYSTEYLAKARQYQILFQQAASNMKEKYQILKDLVDKYAKAEVMFVPGNYDMDLQYTALYTLDLHKKCREFNGLKFCGYGGAPIATSGIPEMVSVMFYEYSVAGKLHSEPLEFFTDNKPDILLLHNPAYATLDKIPSFGHVGSIGIRQYLDENDPLLVLSGHVHSDYGIMRIGNSYCVNPSNFGAVDSMTGPDPGGFFCRLNVESSDANKNKLQSLIIYKCENREIFPVVKITVEGKQMKEDILNAEIHKSMGGYCR